MVLGLYSKANTATYSKRTHEFCRRPSMTTSLHSTVLQPSPSLPPSPTSMSHPDPFEVQPRRSSSSSTSKGKERQSYDEEDREDDGDDHAVNGEGTASPAETAAETRRVEEVYTPLFRPPLCIDTTPPTDFETMGDSRTATPEGGPLVVADGCRSVHT